MEISCLVDFSQFTERWQHLNIPSENLQESLSAHSKFFLLFVSSILASFTKNPLIWDYNMENCCILNENTTQDVRPRWRPERYLIITFRIKRFLQLLQSTWLHDLIWMKITHMTIHLYFLWWYFQFDSYSTISLFLLLCVQLSSLTVLFCGHDAIHLVSIWSKIVFSSSLCNAEARYFYSYFCDFFFFAQSMLLSLFFVFL